MPERTLYTLESAVVVSIDCCDLRRSDSDCYLSILHACLTACWRYAHQIPAIPVVSKAHKQNQSTECRLWKFEFILVKSVVSPVWISYFNISCLSSSLDTSVRMSLLNTEMGAPIELDPEHLSFPCNPQDFGPLCLADCITPRINLLLSA
jgi:hypothetical protein